VDISKKGSWVRLNLFNMESRSAVAAIRRIHPGHERTSETPDASPDFTFTNRVGESDPIN
jgi:hypothetical protein